MHSHGGTHSPDMRNASMFQMRYKSASSLIFMNLRWLAIIYSYGLAKRNNSRLGTIPKENAVLQIVEEPEIVQENNPRIIGTVKQSTVLSTIINNNSILKPLVGRTINIMPIPKQESLSIAYVTTDSVITTVSSITLELVTDVSIKTPQGVLINSNTLKRNYKPERIFRINNEISKTKSIQPRNDDLSYYSKSQDSSKTESEIEGIISALFDQKISKNTKNDALFDSEEINLRVDKMINLNNSNSKKSTMLKLNNIAPTLSLMNKDPKISANKESISTYSEVKPKTVTIKEPISLLSSSKKDISSASNLKTKIIYDIIQDPEFNLINSISLSIAKPKTVTIKKKVSILSQPRQTVLNIEKPKTITKKRRIPVLSITEHTILNTSNPTELEIQTSIQLSLMNLSKQNNFNTESFNIQTTQKPISSSSILRKKTLGIQRPKTITIKEKIPLLSVTKQKNVNDDQLKTIKENIALLSIIDQDSSNETSAEIFEKNRQIMSNNNQKIFKNNEQDSLFRKNKMINSTIIPKAVSIQQPSPFPRLIQNTISSNSISLSSSTQGYIPQSMNTLSQSTENNIKIVTKENTIPNTKILSDSTIESLISSDDQILNENQLYYKERINDKKSKPTQKIETEDDFLNFARDPSISNENIIQNPEIKSLNNMVDYNNASITESRSASKPFDNIFYLSSGDTSSNDKVLPKFKSISTVQNKDPKRLKIDTIQTGDFLRCLSNNRSRKYNEELNTEQHSENMKSCINNIMNSANDHNPFESHVTYNSKEYDENEPKEHTLDKTTRIKHVKNIKDANLQELNPSGEIKIINKPNYGKEDNLETSFNILVVKNKKAADVNKKQEKTAQLNKLNKYFKYSKAKFNQNKLNEAKIYKLDNSDKKLLEVSPDPQSNSTNSIKEILTVGKQDTTNVEMPVHLTIEVLSNPSNFNKAEIKKQKYVLRAKGIASPFVQSNIDDQLIILN